MSNERISNEDLRSFAGEFKNESDRAAVVLAAAKLDYLLKATLESFLLPSSTGDDELLDADHPLSTFSSRINITARLGLIAPDLARALHLVRKIRNSFAHEHSGVSLAAGPHRDRLDTLVQPMRTHWAFNLMLTYFDSQETPAALFRAAVALLMLRLSGLADEVKQVDSGMQQGRVPKGPDPAAATS
jgi:hypothetical protein